MLIYGKNFFKNLIYKSLDKKIYFLSIINNQIRDIYLKLLGKTIYEAQLAFQ